MGVGSVLGLLLVVSVSTAFFFGKKNPVPEPTPERTNDEVLNTTQLPELEISFGEPQQPLVLPEPIPNLFPSMDSYVCVNLGLSLRIPKGWTHTPLPIDQPQQNILLGFRRPIDRNRQNPPIMLKAARTLPQAKAKDIVWRPDPRGIDQETIHDGTFRVAGQTWYRLHLVIREGNERWALLQWSRIQGDLGIVISSDGSPAEVRQFARTHESLVEELQYLPWRSGTEFTNAMQKHHLALNTIGKEHQTSVDPEQGPLEQKKKVALARKIEEHQSKLVQLWVYDYLNLIRRIHRLRTAAQTAPDVQTRTALTRLRDESETRRERLQEVLAHKLQLLTGLYGTLRIFPRVLECTQLRHEFLRSRLGEGSPLVHEVVRDLEMLKPLADSTEKQRQYFQWLEHHAQTDAHHRDGLFLEAVAIQRKAIEISGKLFGTKSYRFAVDLNNLAELYRQLERFHEAYPLYQRAEMILIDGKQTQTPAYVELATNFGTMLMWWGERAEGLASIREAAKMAPTIFFEGHEETADALTNLGGALMEIGKPTEALAQYQRALSIRRKLYAKVRDPHSEQIQRVAESISALGDVQVRLGRYDTALAHYEEALPMMKKALGANHPRYANALAKKANVQAKRGNIPEAIAVLNRALPPLEQGFGKDSERVIQIRQRLAELQVHNGQSGQALLTFQSVRKSSRRFFVSSLPGLSGVAQHLNSLADGTRLTRSLALAFGQRANPEYRNASFEWIVNGKSLAHEAEAELLASARNSNDPIVQQLLPALEKTLQQMKVKVLATSSNEEEAQLELEALFIKREIGMRLAHLGTPPGRWTNTQDIRSALPDKAALVNIVRLEFTDLFGKATQKDRYVAWVVTNENDVAVVDLGEATAIDRMLDPDNEDGMRSALLPQDEASMHAFISARTEKKATQECKQVLRGLSRRILDPILAQCPDAKELVICPDAALWLVPWGALPLENNHFLVEEYDISLAISGRELVRKPFAGRSGPPMIVYDIDYNSGTDQETKPNLPSQSVLGVRGRKNLPDSMDNLASSRAEGKRVIATLRNASVKQIDKLMETEATEAAVRGVKKPDLLFISGHGFFLDLTFEKARRYSEAADPWRRCGLVFAGYNTFAGKPEQQNQCILTGKEASLMDLYGTRLVVLSACSTGEGEPGRAFAVRGLHQAFLVAGARSVAASLWEVDDQETTELMTAFLQRFVQVGHGGPALSQAQREYIRQKDGIAHPFYWAAFQVTGR